MTMQRIVRLTRNANGDTISIPEDFALSSDNVIVRKEGDKLVIEPEVAGARHKSQALLDWLAAREPLPPEDEMGPISREGETRPVRL